MTPQVFPKRIDFIKYREEMLPLSLDSTPELKNLIELFPRVDYLSRIDRFEKDDDLAHRLIRIGKAFQSESQFLFAG
ncbi:hypothetical protein [Candidatus Entotheonella palauensis]|uniref:hypothetical protein n=1 Tax=Candidatus Entotheonella palauensis TaxID=93172 RepID=UPI0015C4C2CB|nr:hypothetical protein [Candidatus Entotheonella palauensis]